MGSESVVHAAKGRMGNWLRGHESERNNCFSKIELVAQKNIEKKICSLVEARLERPVQTLAITRNIVGPNNVISCCAMLANVCKRSQQVTTCWVFRWEYKGLWDVFHLRRHFYFLFACICVDTWHVVRVHRCNFVGPRFDDHETIVMLALVGSEVWPVSNFIQHFPTSRNNTQHGVQTLAIKLDSTMLRLVG